MQLFIDSSNPNEIRQAREWGIINGVTTNPTLIAKGGPDKRRQGTLRVGEGIAELSPELLNLAFREVGRRFEPDGVGRDDSRVAASRQQRCLAKSVAREFAKIHGA